MARQNEQTLELDFRSGIVPSATPTEVGARFRYMQNVGWAPLRHPILPLRRGLAFLPNARMPPVTTFGGTRGTLGLGIEQGGDQGFLGIAAVETSTGDIGFRRLSNGAVLPHVGVHTIVTPAASAPAVYWTGIETPAVYISHPDTNETWRGSESAGIANYEPTNDPGEAFKGNTDLIVHLDRLWMARIRIESGPMDSLVWYTDPFDPETVRPTSFIFIPDNVRALFRPGSVDAGTPQLVMGGDRAVHVLDGDPTLGNAQLRRISYSVGIADRSLVAETSVGAVCRATDGRFYLIRPGAARLDPLPGPEDEPGNPVDRRETLDSLAWSPPYVYYYAANTRRVWVLDLRAEPRWYGPLTFDAAIQQPGRMYPLSPGADNVTAPLYFASQSGGDDPFQHVYKCDPIDPAVTGRTAQLVTGHIFIPDHRVELRRVTLELVQPEGPVAVTVTATRPNGTSMVVTRTAPGLGGPVQEDRQVKLVFDFSRDDRVAGEDYFWLAIAFPEGIEPGVQRGQVKVRIQPAEDAQHV